jgi:hypothetical protein
MKTLAISILCLASVVLADDFKTVSGQEYKNAKVSRAEPDGIVVTFSGGIVKIPRAPEVKMADPGWSFSNRPYRRVLRERWLGQNGRTKYGVNIDSSQLSGNRGAPKAAARQRHLARQTLLDQRPAGIGDTILK